MRFFPVKFHWISKLDTELFAIDEDGHDGGDWGNIGAQML